MEKGEVQALDELGRWEPVRILKDTGDGTVKVSFPGWSRDHDTTIAKCLIRKAIHPFEHEVGE